MPYNSIWQAVRLAGRGVGALAGASLTAVVNAVLGTATPAGTVLVTLSDPFAGQGLGTTSFAPYGSVPGQLALTAGGSITAGSTAAVLGTSYVVDALALSGDSPSSRQVGAAIAVPCAAAGFTALATPGATIAAVGADAGVTPTFTPTYSSDIDQLATSGAGASAKLVVGQVPSYGHVIPGTLNLGSRTSTVTITVAPAATVTAALPSLPLPVGAKVLGHGDSYTGFNNIGNFGCIAAAGATEKGLLEAAFQADPRFNFDSWYAPDPWERDQANGGTGCNGADQGIPADHFVQTTAGTLRGGGILPRIPYSIARAPAIVMPNSLGTNSISSGDVIGQNTPGTTSYVTTQIDAMIGQFVTAGIYVILPTLYPRGDWPIGDARHQTVRDVNTWIRAQSGRTGVLGIVDPYSSLVSSANQDSVNAQYYEEGAGGVHMNSAGIALVQPLLTTILASAITPGSVFDQAAANSNLDSSYGLLGTTGTKTGASSTGSVATGLTLYMARSSGGSTQVGSKDTTSSTYNKQLVTITPGSTGSWDQSRLTFAAITTGLPTAGQWVRAYLFVETAAGSPTANMVFTVNLLDASSVVLVTAVAGAIDSNQYTSATFGVNVAQGRGGYWLATKPFQIPTGTTPASMTRTLVANFWTGGYSAAFTYKVSKPIVRIVSDPRAAWNLP